MKFGEEKRRKEKGERKPALTTLSVPFFITTSATDFKFVLPFTKYLTNTNLYYRQDE